MMAYEGSESALDNFGKFIYQFQSEIFLEIMTYVFSIFFYSNKKIHLNQYAMSLAIYFRQGVVYGLYQDNNPTYLLGIIGKHFF